MKRRLLNLLTAGSLLLCVAVCALWVRSSRGEGDALLFRSDHSLLFSNRRLGMGFRTADGVSPRTSGQSGFEDFGFGWYRMYYRTGDVVLTARGPHWFFALFTAAIPVMRIVSRWRRGRRRAGNRCVLCDYDLTRNESGVCPECGAPVSVSATG